MNIAVFGKAMQNMRRPRNIKLVTTERRTSYLVSEPNDHATKIFTESLLAIEMKKTQIWMNNLVYLGLSILYLSKTVIYGFWYNYVKPKYGENAKLCYMVTDSFTVYVKPEHIYKYFAKDVEERNWHFNFWIRQTIS